MCDHTLVQTYFIQKRRIGHCIQWTMPSPEHALFYVSNDQLRHHKVHKEKLPAVSLMTAGDHFNLPKKLVWVCVWVNILTFSTLRVYPSLPMLVLN